MSGVDHPYQNIATYCTAIKSKKWSWAFLIWIPGIVVQNLQILFRNNKNWVQFTPSLIYYHSIAKFSMHICKSMIQVAITLLPIPREASYQQRNMSTIKSNLTWSVIAKVSLKNKKAMVIADLKQPLTLLKFQQTSQLFEVCLPYLVFSFWYMQSHAHTPAHAPLVWCVQKIAHAISVYYTYCLGKKTKDHERQNKSIKFNSTSTYDFRIRENS